MTVQDRIILTRLAFVHYQHADPAKFKEFATDFGLDLADERDGFCFYRGYGTDQYVYVDQMPSDGQEHFIGAGFSARSEEDFNKACNLEGAKIMDISQRPGAGKLVSIKDPNGFEIQILWGQEQRSQPGIDGISASRGPHPTTNGSVRKTRKGSFVRLERGPAKIHKAGHFGYMTENYDKTCQWYQRWFNFVPMDILHLPGNESIDIATFFRLDLGKDYVDHHCLLITRMEGGTKVHHASFEVEDLDTQFVGHQWLREHGHQLVWGIGRHVLGSQVYDYWYDPSKFIVEHYTDGDLVNEENKAGRQEAGEASIWGPPLPAEFGGR